MAFVFLLFIYFLVTRRLRPNTNTKQQTDLRVETLHKSLNINCLTAAGGESQIRRCKVSEIPIEASSLSFYLIILLNGFRLVDARSLA